MKVIIIGAGASGCFAAANLSSKCEVIILEKSLKPLQKVRVSGGGRCNVTHACFDPRQLLAFYPRGRRILNKTLAQFSPQNTIDWFKERDVTLKTEPDGRMFPVTDKSETIIECLLGALQKKNVSIYYQHQVNVVQKTENGFEVGTANGRIFYADILIIASGGYSKAEQYNWMHTLIEKLETPLPSLFTFNIPDKSLHQLMGLSVPMVQVKIDGIKTTTQGAVLITHWGLSGPAILKMSAFAAKELAAMDYHFVVRINWVNEKQVDIENKLLDLKETRPTQKISGQNFSQLPKRLWHYFLEKINIDAAGQMQQVTNKQLIQLAALLTHDLYTTCGKTTFKEEFVTCGGISLSQLQPENLESKNHPGLYAIGEAIDVDGVTGGFNFQHAWSSAYLVAQQINARL